METKQNVMPTPEQINTGIGDIGGLLMLLMSSSFLGSQPLSNATYKSYYESMYGKHFNEILGKAKVSALHYTEVNGEDKTGEHWSVEKIKELTTNKQFHDSVTDWDKYVAYNYMYSLLCNTISYEQILEATHKMWFENQIEFGKIWDYMSVNR